MVQLHEIRSVSRLGGEVRFDLIGVGRRDVVCVPGGNRPIDDLVEFANELVARSDVRMVLVQPRGHPGSNLPLGDHTLADLASDVVAVIGDLGRPPAVVLGHAFGNRVVRMAATLRPDLVAGVVLCSAGGLAGPTKAFFVSMAFAVDKDRPMDERIAAFRRAYFEEGSNPMVWWRPGPAALTKAINAEPVHVWWAGGDCPMLVVQGELDQASPPSNGEALERSYPERVTLHTIKGATHTVPIERPAEFAELVANWLGTALSALE
jgi:pimeloyl-ACP methyl ester carboxylesterase